MGIDKVGIDEVGIDKVGIDEVGIDEVGRYRRHVHIACIVIAVLS